jgi:hypothetical protein
MTRPRPYYRVDEADATVTFRYYNTLARFIETFDRVIGLRQNRPDDWVYEVNRQAACRAYDDLLGRGLIDE